MCTPKQIEHNKHNTLESNKFWSAITTRSINCEFCIGGKVCYLVTVGVSSTVSRRCWDGLCKQLRLLVTHAIHWLPSVDTVVVMRNGQISESGSYQDLLSHDKAFAQFLKTYLMQDDEDDDTETDVEGEPLLC